MDVELGLLEFGAAAIACVDMDIAQATANVERNVMLFSIAGLPVGSSCGQASRAGRGRRVYTQDQVPLLWLMVPTVGPHPAVFS